MSKEVQLECLDRLPWLKASNKKRNQRGKIWKEKSDLSTDHFFGRISLLKNPIDTRLDGLEPWLQYLQLSSFEFFEIINFWRPKLTHKLLLQTWTEIKIEKVLFYLDT